MRTHGRQRGLPYAADHARSIAGRARPPRDLLAWLLRSFREELPEELHAGGLWRDRVSADERRVGIEPVGGSLIGTPRTAELFRRYIEESPFTTEVAEYDGHKDQANHYAFPLRAALARLAGRGRDDEPYPFMARALHLTAIWGGDWDGALAALGVNPPAVRRPYLERALHQLWDRYEVEPVIRAA